MTCKTISIVNQKGGVGKTTTTMNLSTALCAMDKKVLVIDLDPQSNSTSGLGIDFNGNFKTSYDLIIGTSAVEGVPTIIPNLFIIPANMDLSGAEIELAVLPNKESYLKKALESLQNKYDYIFIDCPPSLGLLTVNALVASNEIIIPLQCEYFALEGLSHLIKTVRTINVSLNTMLKIRGIILTMYDKRNRLSKMVDNDVRKHYGSLVYKTVIPRNVRISEAPSYGYPVIVYDPSCAGSESYINLASELIRQDNINNQ